jgi:hypothetical protein
MRGSWVVIAWVEHRHRKEAQNKIKPWHGKGKRRGTEEATTQLEAGDLTHLSKTTTVLAWGPDCHCITICDCFDSGNTFKT